MKVDLYSALESCPADCQDADFECEAVELPADGCELAGGMRLRIVVDCAHSGVCMRRGDNIRTVKVGNGVVPL